MTNSYFPLKNKGHFTTAVAIIAMVLCYSFLANAQEPPTIIFYPSEGSEVLTREDTDRILKSYDLSSKDSFHAIIERAKKIGDSTFFEFPALLSVRSSSVVEIGEFAFCGCSALAEISFSNVTAISVAAFNMLFSDILNSVSFGTDFTSPTKIKFESSVFNNFTNRIDLTLGEYVLPKPKEGNFWHYGSGHDSIDIPGNHLYR